MACFGTCDEDDTKLSTDEIPCKKRSLRDIPCLIVFLLTLAGMAATAFVAFSEGSLHRLLHGYDNYGNVCGQRNKEISSVSGSGLDTSSKEILLLYDGLSDDDRLKAYQDFGEDTFHLLNRTCVEECLEPSEQIATLCLHTTYQRSRVTSNNDTSQPILSRVTGEMLSPVAGLFEQVSRDVELAWPQLVAICVVAFVLSMVLLVMLRYFAWAIVYAVVIIVALGAIVASSYLWYMYSEAAELARNSDQPEKRFRERDALNLILLAVIATIFTCLLLIVIFVMGDRIRLVIALFREAGKVIQDIPQLLLQPLVTFLATVIMVSAWLVVALCIESIETAVSAKNSGFIEYRKETLTLFLRYFYLFALIWLCQFLVGCQDMVIGGTVSLWFFTRDKTQLQNPVRRSLKNLLLYHLGSVALGSFLIALVRAVRAMMRRLRSVAADGIMRSLCCCAQCCAWCCDKVLQLLTRNAYVEIAIYGCSFCQAAKQAFNILTRNAVRVAAINSLGTFVLMLAKASVTIATVFVGIEIMKSKPEVVHSHILIAIGGLFAYSISYVFISVYEMAIDTLFVCFCEDCEINDGITSPFYMSKGLMEYVEQSRKSLAAKKRKRNQTAPVYAVTSVDEKQPKSDEKTD